MTPPRRVFPGATYLVTRRCSERRFFLRPSALTSQIFLFVLAVAARRHGVLVHAFCVLSNHCHIVLTDRTGQLPAFMQYLDSLVARAVNASLGRFEGFWAVDGSYSAVEPLDLADILAKTAYVLANPVAAGLVRRGSEWPGLWTAPGQIGVATLVAHRPKVFFSETGAMPETAELALEAPRGFASAKEFQSLLADALDQLERKHQDELAAAGRRFLGVARVRGQDPFSRPRGGEPRFGLNPRIAAGDKWRRIGGIRRLKSFVREYRDASGARRAGVAEVLFPAGTYLLRVLHGVQCAGAA